VNRIGYTVLDAVSCAAECVVVAAAVLILPVRVYSNG